MYSNDPYSARGMGGGGGGWGGALVGGIKKLFGGGQPGIGSYPMGAGPIGPMPQGGGPGIGGPGALKTGVGLGAPGMGSAIMQMAYDDEKRPNFGGPPNLDPMPVPGVPQGAAPQGGGGWADALRGTVGNIGGGVLDFLGGNDGQNGLMTAAMLANLHGAHQDRKEYGRQTERRESLEDEERRRYDTWQPERNEAIGRIRGRIGG